MDISNIESSRLRDSAGVKAVEAGRHLLALAEGLPHPAWVATGTGNWLWSNSLWSGMTGLSAEESRGLGWQQALDAPDAAAFNAAWRRAAAEGPFEVEHLLMKVNGLGEGRWFSTHAAPVGDMDGAERLWLGVCTDVDRLKRLEQREAAAHDHTTSLLALARHVTRRTALTTDDRDSYMLHVDSRLDAIARVHALSRRHPEMGVRVGDMIDDALLAHGAQDGERVELDGLEMRLHGWSGEIFGLVVNELAMNAVKHGALSDGLGRLVVRWRVESGAEKRLRFEWLETGVSVAEVPPCHAGYGTALIETILPKETGAVASFGFGQRGVCCTIVLPLRD